MKLFSIFYIPLDLLVRGLELLGSTAVRLFEPGAAAPQVTASGPWGGAEGQSSSPTLPLAAQVRMSQQISDSALRPLPPSDQTPGRAFRPLLEPSFSSKVRTAVAWPYIRPIARICKVLLIGAVAWIVCIGQPMRLLEALWIVLVEIPMGAIGYLLGLL